MRTARRLAKAPPATPQTSLEARMGSQPLNDRQRLERAASAPLTGGRDAPPAGGLFDADARAQLDLVDWMKEQ